MLLRRTEAEGSGRRHDRSPSLHLGPRLGIERCGKRNASNSGAESWTGIGVVAGFGAVVLITQGPLVKNVDTYWGIKLHQILQEVRRMCKTCNQLHEKQSVLPPHKTTTSDLESPA